MERVSGTTEASGSPTSPFPEMQWRLASYGVSALAVTGLLVAPAGAAVISWTPSNLDATIGSPIVFDFLTGSAINSSAGPSADTFELSVESRVNTRIASSGTHFTTRHVTATAIGAGGRSNIAGNGGGAYHLSNNTLVSGGQLFRGKGELFNAIFSYKSGVLDSESHFGAWIPTGDNAYLGFEFDNGGTTDYGWANVIVNGNSALTLKKFEYDNTGAPVAVGATGIPGGGAAPDANPLLLLVVGGATAMAAYRKRRHEGALAA